ncbi:hypothetical protein [Saccharothrix xinjiangensis]|uniref:Uncharacterized protein n=1 Tax=Saccharothrix xinjiangensis TaxID=204798 RepID=A0ABV9XSK5_9PSEU
MLIRAHFGITQSNNTLIDVIYPGVLSGAFFLVAAGARGPIGAANSKIIVHNGQRKLYSVRVTAAW